MAAAPATALPLLDAARRAEADDLVGAVAERAHARLAAAAQRDGAPSDLDLVAVLVGEPERAPHEQRAVAVWRDRRRVVHPADRTRARRSDTRPGSMRPMLLEGRKLLVTGVLTESSIAFSIARRAQEEGAELVLTGFGRGLRITQRVARRLPTEPDVLDLDVNDDGQLEATAAEVEKRWGRLDGVVHAIAFVPGDAMGGNFLTAPSASALAAFETSAFSMKALAAALLPLLERAEDPGGAIVGLDFDAQVAWPAYDWAGVSKAALESVNRYLARDLGPRRIRSNLVAAGPLSTVAASNIDGFDVLAEAWQRQAPLGWDMSDPEPVADACVYLLSPLARAVTGEILHVDGGLHAVGAAPADAGGAGAVSAPSAPGAESAPGPSDEA